MKQAAGCWQCCFTSRSIRLTSGSIRNPHAWAQSNAMTETCGTLLSHVCAHTQSSEPQADTYLCAGCAKLR